MRIKLENIGKVKSADVEINGITVIAGENNTGKSTVGKALWSVFNAMADVEKRLQHGRYSNILQYLYMIFNDRYMSVDTRVRIRRLAEKLAKNIDYEQITAEELKNKITSGLKDIQGLFENHKDYVDIQIQLDELVKRLLVNRFVAQVIILDNVLNKEFDGGVSNFFAKGSSHITLGIKGQNITINIHDNSVESVESDFYELMTDAIYYDNPYLLDRDFRMNFVGRDAYLRHEDDLCRKLSTYRDVDIVSEKHQRDDSEKLYAEISKIIPGKLLNKNDSFEYTDNETDVTLNIRSLSTGLKGFAVLKRLIDLKKLEYNGVLILDEPESHLHPEWQIKFAEIIILLQKAFHLHILLNTHSPYFLEAIETYAQIHGVTDICNYYLATNISDKESKIKMVEHNEEIYSLLAKPFEDLDELKYAKR